jgi:hypothetical protein
VCIFDQLHLGCASFTHRVRTPAVEQRQEEVEMDLQIARKPLPMFGPRPHHPADHLRENVLSAST